MIQHAYWLPLTFQSLNLKWVDLIGPQVQTPERVGLAVLLKNLTGSQPN
jgi:hypothetical protein